jgi:hypothetical protein
MNHARKSINRVALPLFVALSLHISLTPMMMAAPGDTNSTNTSRDIAGGTYYNTQGSRTTFKSNGNAGLWLRGGRNLRGLEVNSQGGTTGNGGTFYFRAPGAVVRLDGNVDVSAWKQGGFYLGNGGKVFVDAAYLYQTGKVMANGVNGGLVQYNVGAATIGPNARISAQGFGGNGGQISINASGVVDIRQGSILDASGKVAGTYDTSVINIEGGVVNNQGIIRANGIAGSDPKSNDSNVVPEVIWESESQDSPGGTVRLVATGQSEQDCVDCAVNATSVFTAAEKVAINARNNALIQNSDGSVINSGIIQANGTDGVLTTDDYGGWSGGNGSYDDSASNGQHGGTIIIAAANNVSNSGTIEANGGDGLVNFEYGASGGSGGTGEPGGYSGQYGYEYGYNNGLYATEGGDGGTISINALNNISNSGDIHADGGDGGSFKIDFDEDYKSHTTGSYSYESGSVYSSEYTYGASGGEGGDGGLVAFGYGGNMSNSGDITANGGNGGKGQDTEGYSNASAYNYYGGASASAIVIGGGGGQGGDGGLIVFSGPENPDNTGLIQANGGVGGDGGAAYANSSAYTYAGSSYYRYSYAGASGGNSGSGGASGTIVVPNTETDFDYEAQEGQDGIYGPAEADAQTSLGSTGGSGGSGTTGYAQAHAVSGDNFQTVTKTDDTQASAAVVADSGSNESGGNNYLQQTQENELLLNNETIILLSQDYWEEGNYTYLSDRVDEAQYRYANYDEYTEDYLPRNVVIFDNSRTQEGFILDISSEGSEVNSRNFDTDSLPLVVNTITVLSNDDLSNDGDLTAGVYAEYEEYEYSEYDEYEGYYEYDFNQAGGHISIVTSQGFYNYGDINTVGQDSGGSINIAAGDVLLNFDDITTSPGANYYEESITDHGGSIIVKSGEDLVNLDYIGGGSYEAQVGIGSTIQLFAGNDIVNIGEISSSFAYTYNGETDAQGGIIISRAHEDNLNFGYYGANAYAENYQYEDSSEGGAGNDSIATGGYIHLDGGNTVVNGDPNFRQNAEEGYYGEATIEANGRDAGGKIILSAGGNDTGGLDFEGDGDIDGLTFTNGITPGSGTFSNGIDTNQGESVYQFGEIDATYWNEEGGTNGSILLVAENQVGIGFGAEFADSNWDFGSSPLSNLANFADDGSNVTLAAGRGMVDLLLCGPRPEGAEGGPDADGPNVDISGLFPAGWPGNNVENNVGTDGQVIAFGQPTMFVLREYSDITANILEQAMGIYTNQLADGSSEDEAKQDAENFLKGAGVDAQAAALLMEQLDDGSIEADEKVKEFLADLMKEQPETSSNVEPSQGDGSSSDNDGGSESNGEPGVQ